MSAGPVVSAVITTHDYARFLPAAIDSVLAQSYADLEIVVVDDGSTDGTAAVVERYAERGVRYVRRPRGGAGRARNTGLEATSGPLIAFLDGDDAWLPDRVAAGVAHLERHPELALVGGHAVACDERLAPAGVVHVPRRAAARMLEPLLVQNLVLNPSSVLIRRSALAAAGGFSEIPVGQDWDTWIELAKRFPIGFVDQPVALVRRHSGGISPRRGRHRIDVNRAIVERHLPAVRPAWKRPLIRRRAASASYFRAGLSGARRGERGLARRYALAAVVLDPVTLARRKAALLVRLFVSEALVRAIRDRTRRG